MIKSVKVSIYVIKLIKSNSSNNVARSKKTNQSLGKTAYCVDRIFFF